MVRHLAMEKTVINCTYNFPLHEMHKILCHGWVERAIASTHPKDLTIKPVLKPGTIFS